MKVRLRQAIIELVHEDPELAGKVAAALDVSYTTVPRLLTRNHPKLTQKAVLQVISKHLKLSENELLDTVSAEDKRVELGNNITNKIGIAR